MQSKSNHCEIMQACVSTLFLLLLTLDNCMGFKASSTSLIENIASNKEIKVGNTDNNVAGYFEPKVLYITLPIIIGLMILIALLAECFGDGFEFRRRRDSLLPEIVKRKKRASI
ncbi:uncharacterized protein CMU_005810 [Cryptosporidium muris RN66]|uniref:Uncharacterized protein n=1 Tax=Cryptosporidium muris (strain RN66) TaxID=441375 RepID=B6AHG3_CRYMR|nr:uncharacterized protein CMU_005810 [Cryptosporidium muris RN66]EEA07658.1 hypothetical protein CMU_005810 [Cryptosporidium muris RN66]|eukprot:XP_002142007.1 hypothetical protein [Cryptosporidium muris RN66]